MQSQQMEVIDGVLEAMGYPNYGFASVAMNDMALLGATTADQVAPGSSRTSTCGFAKETVCGERTSHRRAIVPSPTALGCAREFRASEPRWTQFSTSESWELSWHPADALRSDAIKLDVEPKLRAKKRA